MIDDVPDKCKSCNLCFEGECHYYGEMSCLNAIQICETDEFLAYTNNKNDEE